MFDIAGNREQTKIAQQNNVAIFSCTSHHTNFAERVTKLQANDKLASSLDETQTQSLSTAEVKHEVSSVSAKPKPKPQRSSSERRVGFANSVAVQTEDEGKTEEPDLTNGNSNGDEVPAIEPAVVEEKPTSKGDDFVIFSLLSELILQNNVVEKIKSKNRINRKGLAPSLTWFLRPLEHEQDTVHQFAQIGSVQVSRMRIQILIGSLGN